VQTEKSSLFLGIPRNPVPELRKPTPFPSSYSVETVLVNGALYTDYDYSEGRLHINNLALSVNDDWLILLNV
jgi:hypothetical protein